MDIYIARILNGILDGTGRSITEQRHTGQDKAILNHRSTVYEAAKQARPERWKNRSIRNWKPVEAVWLNPSREHDTLPEHIRLAA